MQTRTTRYNVCKVPVISPLPATPTLSSLQTGCPSCHQPNSVRALKTKCVLEGVGFWMGLTGLNGTVVAWQRHVLYLSVILVIIYITLL